MTWFSYKKQGETSFSYPYVKRKISKFTPMDIIAEGTWLFVDVSDLDIDQKVNAQLVKTTDASAYVVVYESSIESSTSVLSYEDGTTGESNFFLPVESVVNNNVLYFKAAEDHLSNEEITFTYAVYYHTPNLRYIAPVESVDSFYYQVTTSAAAPFDSSFSSVDRSSFEVTLDSTTYYNFSFVNQAFDWDSGLSSTAGAKAYLSFTGPLIELYCSKGPDFGKFRLKIISTGNDATPNSIVNVDWTVIDLYSSSYQENVLVYSIDNLRDGNCSLEIEVLAGKNTLSSGNKVKLNSYQFSYNVELTLGSEELTEQTTFVSLGSLR